MSRGIIAAGIHRPLNWRPSRPDHRDYKFRPTTAAIAASVDPLDIPLGIPIWDQGNLGSCTAHGTGFVWAHRMQTEGKGQIMPSRLFIYYCEREIEGTTGDDDGAVIRDGLTALANDGCPFESVWPYVISQFTVKPPDDVYKAALADVALEYSNVSLDKFSIQAALTAGNPITFGFTVFESFNNVGADGIMPLPGKNEDVMGGHCVAIVGYNADGLWCRNSWSASWGKDGRFLMPWANLDNCDDAWVLTKVQ